MQGDAGRLAQGFRFPKRRRDLPSHETRSLVQSSIDIHGPDPVLILLTMSTDLEIQSLVVRRRHRWLSALLGA